MALPLHRPSSCPARPLLLQPALSCEQRGQALGKVRSIPHQILELRLKQGVTGVAVLRAGRTRV